jgi:small neutral amino acid transporter SnatA (MarC family)
MNDKVLSIEFLKSAVLLFVILNPFLMTIYLIPIGQKLKPPAFRRVLLHASFISFLVFSFFAWTGDLVFTNLLQVNFASFLIFGGTIFLVIGLRFALIGPDAILQLYGKPEHVSGAIAMPFMIGPGTVSASVLAGARHTPPVAFLAILFSVSAAVLFVSVLSQILDHLRSRHEELFQRYVDLVGRMSAIVMGTIAVQMILNGLDLWLGR